jgi:DNA-binding response OmpR family regulator
MTMADIRNNPWTFVLDEPTRILVVDDDPILREFASVHLATPHATVDTACDGAVAQILLRRNSYDVLLLDIEMPNLNGFALLESIRSNDALKHLPVIMLTAHEDIVSIDRAYKLGANSFVTKPVNWRLLSHQIRYVIRAGRLESGHAPRQDDCDPHEFLQSAACRAAAIETQLSADDRARYSQALRDIRVVAQRAVAATPGQAPISSAEADEPTFAEARFPRVATS